MLPAQRNKVDISKLTEEEQKLFRLYGKLPNHKSAITKMQKDRKYFDSGDYAMSKAGKTPQGGVGTAIPNPENIPHATPSPSINTASPGLSTSGSSSSNALTSPIKELPGSHNILSPSNLSHEGNVPEVPQPNVEARDPLAEAGKAVAAESDATTTEADMEDA